MRQFNHFLYSFDGARRIDGLLGVAVSAGALSYLVRWEDGSSSRMEQHDASVTPFDFEKPLESDPLYRQIHDSWALWRKPKGAHA